ncbi:DHA2 family efflux MFS transporter permease subunit [Methylopila sp. M107]|uniref:DHA2 family efflux MFS transporter permease subunit n=1 Tax=Methylopila sp. M107 TaxID=1101190 RepID=UPI0003A3E3B0|nr:DHA2 family efflux MFS transporter permease subunit [Methylopila sp. M107]
MTPAAEPPSPSLAASTWIGFAAMCAGMFMAVLDVQIVATSLPAIQRALAIEPDQMSWIQTAYLIAEVIAIPLTGFLTRMLGMRRLFVGSLTIFTLASAGCAASGSFGDLIAWRVLQGLSGGTLIPAVFSAVFVLFPTSRQGVATTLAGVLAVLAPTVGPIVGGWITESQSWHWLFLINLAPGVVAATAGFVWLPREAARWGKARTLDVVSLALLATALCALQIGLKESPQRGWADGLTIGLFALSIATGATFARRTLGRAVPLVDLACLADRRFALGCLLSFVLGVGLFGSVYLMPVFLAFVRGHNAFEIGSIMLVTGLAQLLVAPIAVWLEQRVNARLLTAGGFAMFATGLAMSAFQTPRTDFADMIAPQIVRGVAIMFCLLPPTRLALGHLEASRVPDASGLFNLMRNLGGAIGIALIDTVIFARAPSIGETLKARLLAGDFEASRFVGLPDALFRMQLGATHTPRSIAMMRPMVEKAAMTQAINDAWAMIAAMTALAIFCLLFARPVDKQAAK